MEAGRVATGFSYPVVSKYSNSGGTVSFADGMVLARGVSVELDVTVAEDNNFYANNVVAESDNGRFESGSMTLTVDGLNPTARSFIQGLPEPEPMTYGSDPEESVDVIHVGDSAAAPYVAVGVIGRYRSGGQDIFVPYVFPKTRFHSNGLSLATQEESIDWQTEELTADVNRDDSPNHDWRLILADQSSEQAAMDVLNGILKVNTSAAAAFMAIPKPTDAAVDFAYGESIPSAGG